ncbi:SDR family NAD(P)-dependent oxidoreductase [Amycolatopsis sp. NPDC049868]|uniref:SDR family NAD(P)-dependent oxidoreductase n=1 Tax=Amycolatopsis sp. NPDC049868 TaxID=3363934 RepID=UPI0037B6E796
MKTIVVSGGTSGIGRELAKIYLERGEQVVVLGPDPEKGRGFLDAAESAGAGGRAFFIQADLSLVSENRRVIEEIKAGFAVVDALVLCARYFRSHRAMTAEGFEHNFALYYLSRYLLGYGLADPMNKAEDPVVLNIAGPGMAGVEVQWDDLGLERGYDGWAAMFQGGKLNDLLGISYAAEHRGNRSRYVLLFPGGTRTGLAGEFDAATAARVAEMKKGGRPVEQVTAPITRFIDHPPREPLSAFIESRRISVDHPLFDRDGAARLEALTQKMLREGVTA